MMPVVHFRPVEQRKATKGLHSTPMYMYPIRDGPRERPSFVMEVDLRCGNQDSAFWVKRSAALLLSLAD